MDAILMSAVRQEFTFKWALCEFFYSETKRNIYNFEVAVAYPPIFKVQFTVYEYCLPRKDTCLSQNLP
jgi:DNA gyrase/topoisomerase IV subunit B